MKKEPRIRLTKAQRELKHTLEAHPGSTIRGHKTYSGGHCYRLMDWEFNPVRNYKTIVVNKLFEKDYLVRDKDGVFYIKKVEGKEIKSLL